MDEKPKYSEEECKARDATYACPLKVRMRLHHKETGEIKEQEIFMGDFPRMTDSGTFIINGAERAIVSQIVRSPGVYYGRELDKTDKAILSATVIPYRGAWLEYETDMNDVFYVRIDKNRKIPITSFIRAIGVKTDAEMTAAGKTPVSWNFTTMPSEEWKNGVGTALAIYAADQTDDNCAGVVSAFVDGWATEYALANG